MTSFWLAFCATVIVISVTGSSIDQGAFSIHPLQAGIEVDTNRSSVGGGIGVIFDHMLNINFDPTNGVDDVGKSGKFHANVMIDFDAKILFDGLAEECHSGSGFIDFTEEIHGVNHLGTIIGHIDK